MKRKCSLEEISDGRLYEISDLVTASCNGCKGAASCCHGMGNSIVLDPYDIYRITDAQNLSFEELLGHQIELNIVDGVILPNLKMNGPSGACAFLSDAGRCRIHSIRPGICRIFPLGRYYENHDFKYFLQTKECHNQSETQTGVSKWIDTPDYAKNRKFLIDWHYLLNDMENIIMQIRDEVTRKNITMYLLQSFYVKKFETGVDFYLQFHKRLRGARELVKVKQNETEMRD